MENESRMPKTTNNHTNKTVTVKCRNSGNETNTTKPQSQVGFGLSFEGCQPPNPACGELLPVCGRGVISSLRYHFKGKLPWEVVLLMGLAWLDPKVQTAVGQFEGLQLLKGAESNINPPAIVLRLWEKQYSLANLSLSHNQV